MRGIVSSITTGDRAQKKAADAEDGICRIVWAHTVELRRFLLVGAGNTLLDYVLFLALTKIMRLPLSWVWVAKLISGTVAISISFYLNRTWVFRAAGARAGQAVKFVTTTLIAVYAIQTPLTQVFTSLYPDLGQTIYNALVPSILASLVTPDFTIKTVAFTLATLPSLTFNFLLYQNWVFRKKKQA
jgi:putative flippase GtrA